ncbi:MAG: hypothetical protein GMKNLPBB_00248 [Myxococcota bacterium]|nr:hypothetical protein [Myxococcota bacterium]
MAGKAQPSTGRRSFLRWIAGAGVLAGAGALISRRIADYRFTAPGGKSLQVFSEAEAQILAAAVECYAPGGFPAAAIGECVLFADGFAAQLPPDDRVQLSALLYVIEHSTPLLGHSLRRFSSLELTDRRAWLDDWITSSLGFRRLGGRAMTQLCAMSLYQHPASFPSIHYSGPQVPERTPPEHAPASYRRWIAPDSASPAGKTG